MSPVPALLSPSPRSASARAAACGAAAPGDAAGDAAGIQRGFGGEERSESRAVPAASSPAQPEALSRPTDPPLLPGAPPAPLQRNVRAEPRAAPPGPGAAAAAEARGAHGPTVPVPAGCQPLPGQVGDVRHRAEPRTPHGCGEGLELPWAARRLWAVCECPAAPLASAALGKRRPRARGWGRLWASCAELALPSLCAGDPGDTTAGDRDSGSVTQRPRRAQRVLVQRELHPLHPCEQRRCEGQEGGLKTPSEPGCLEKMDVFHPFCMMLQFQICQGFPWQ